MVRACSHFVQASTSVIPARAGVTGWRAPTAGPRVQGMPAPSSKSPPRMESVAKLQILLRFGGSSAARPDKGMARESAGIGISQRTPGWGETFRSCAWIPASAGMTEETQADGAQADGAQTAGRNCDGTCRKCDRS